MLIASDLLEHLVSLLVLQKLCHFSQVLPERSASGASEALAFLDLGHALLQPLLVAFGELVHVPDPLTLLARRPISSGSSAVAPKLQYLQWRWLQPHLCL